MNNKTGLYRAGLIINIVFSSIGFVTTLGFVAWAGAVGPVIVVLVICLTQIVLSSVALHILKDTSRKRTKGFGIASGIIGLFTTPFFIGGILTLVGVSSLNKPKYQEHSQEAPAGNQGPYGPALEGFNDDGYVPRDTGV